MATKWTDTDDGWQAAVSQSSVGYRLLVSDSGSPRYQGAARRYAEVWAAHDGSWVRSKSAAGYWRKHSTVAEAKAAVTPKTSSPAEE